MEKIKTTKGKVDWTAEELANDYMTLLSKARPKVDILKFFKDDADIEGGDIYCLMEENLQDKKWMEKRRIPSAGSGIWIYKVVPARRQGFENKRVENALQHCWTPDREDFLKQNECRLNEQFVERKERLQTLLDSFTSLDDMDELNLYNIVKSFI